MTIDEAIKHAKKVAEVQEEAAKEWHEHENNCKKCAEEHRQLAEWLIELKKYREKDRYNNYDVCLGGFHND